MATRCVKCGRPLTNPKSQRARVGTTCIQRYGPQPRLIPNPARAVWESKRTAADADRSARQAQLDAEYESALAHYNAARAARRH